MKYIETIKYILLIAALALPVSASAVNSWTQSDIPGHNLTVNYTSSFDVQKNDTLAISIINVGNESLNDTITINEINVSEGSASKAKGNWTGPVMIAPNTTGTIDYMLEITTDEAATVDVIIYFNVSSDSGILSVTAHYPGAVTPPAVISWNNNKTGDESKNLTINTSETVTFNFTASQTLTSWLWTLNGNYLANSSDTLTHTFDINGTYEVAANGSNDNGSTQTITWMVTVGEEESEENESILSWSPEMYHSVYVNDTVSETIEYSISTVEPMTVSNWSIDGVPVVSAGDDPYSYNHTWDNASIGSHTVTYQGNNNGSNVEFTWYVDVLEIDGVEGGSLIDIIDEALENHATDIKIRMFKEKVAKNGGGNSAFAAQMVNQLHDGIARRQMTREAMRMEFKAGNITVQEYVAALKYVQRDAKYNVKLAKGLAKIAKEDLNNETISGEFENISQMENTKVKGKKMVNLEPGAKGKKKGAAGTEGISDEKEKNKGRKNRGIGQ